MGSALKATNFLPWILISVILDGWPENKNDAPLEAWEHWNIRDELCYVNGIMMKGENIVVPKSMRPEMLSVIHTGHMGDEKCKNRARELLFWPGMCHQISELVSKCLSIHGK